MSSEDARRATQHFLSGMLLLDALKSRVKQEYPKLAGNYGRDRSSISCKDEAGEEVPEAVPAEEARVQPGKEEGELGQDEDEDKEEKNK